MTIKRVRPATWGVGEKLTSAQANGLDENAAAALDKRPNQTDTLSSVISCAGAGRILPSMLAGPDADADIQVGNGNSFIFLSTLAQSRTWVLRDAGAQPGDQVTIFAAPTAQGGVVTIRREDGTVPFVLGYGDSGDGSWATFVWLAGAGWQLFQFAPGQRFRSVTFTTSGEWVAPRGVTQILVGGYGGGGGGGHGTARPASWTSTNPVNLKTLVGGSGGGGSMFGLIPAQVVSGTRYPVPVGDGGAPGGGPGGDSGVGPLVRLAGAEGGANGTPDSLSGTASRFFLRGGGPIRGMPSDKMITFATDATAQAWPREQLVPAQGGFALSLHGLAGPGAPNLVMGPVSLGGPGGIGGYPIDQDSEVGGGGGGGGGGPQSGPTIGSAPKGGDGGGWNFGPEDGGSAPPNSGAGGGGGGAAGLNDRASAGGQGGRGGSGLVTIMYVK